MRLVHLATALSLAGLSVAASAQNVAKGKAIFAQCAACHGVDAGVPKMGPDLKGVYRRHAGAVEDYNYSPAMKRAPIVWDSKTLDAYLAAPRTVVPGTKMPFAGLSNAADRANVVAYLKSLGAGK